MSIKSHVLHQIAANYIVGRKVDIEIKGSKIQTECFERLLKTSKKLKESLDNRHSLDEINKLIETKKQLSDEFQNLTGITWNL